MGKIFIKYYIYSSEIFQNAAIVYGFNLPTEKDLQKKKLSVAMKQFGVAVPLPAAGWQQRTVVKLI